MLLRLDAPAKLNLHLAILGRRPDGFHELETVFERIDLCDELTFEPADDLQLTCDRSDLSCGDDNLILRAARRLRQAAGIRLGARIHLTKRIPIAAGLGGGSSDAATALLGLDQLWGTNLSRTRLQELGAEIGSDVPFFLSPYTFAIGRGRGERLESAVPDGLASRVWHVLVVPEARLSTKEVYEGYAASQTGFSEAATALTGAGRLSSMWLHALRNGSLGELARGLRNDLQPEAIRRCPVIQRIHTELLSSGCVGVMTSGSGPAVFGLCHDAAHAAHVVHMISARAAVPASARQTSGRWLTRAVATFQEGSVGAACV